MSEAVASGFLPACVYYLPTLQCGGLGGGRESGSLVANTMLLLLLLLLHWCGRWWLWDGCSIRFMMIHVFDFLCGEASQLSRL